MASTKGARLAYAYATSALSRHGLREACIAGLAALVLVSCTPRGETPPVPPLPDGYSLRTVSFSDLPGWDTDPVAEALPAIERSCGVFARRTNEKAWVGPGEYGGTAKDWKGLCAELARVLPPSNRNDETALRAFLEQRLQPYAVTLEGNAQGTFTGYYEAELAGALERSEDYPVPLHGPPNDIVTVDMSKRFPDMAGVKLIGRPQGDEVVPYWTRAEIEDGYIGDVAPVVLWAADPVDAHILHIQGSGRVALPDGQVVRVGYAGNNGHKFVGIGRVMMDRGLLEPGKASMPAIREWLKANPVKAAEVMRANPRYIFFRRIEGDGPIGALGVPLTERRSIAVDPKFVPLGVPLWLDSHDPDGRPLHRLMVAQDVGSAIKGAVRGDFFWGPGESALYMAGRMKSTGTWYLLLPKSRAPQPSS